MPTTEQINPGPIKKNVLTLHLLLITYNLSLLSAVLSHEHKEKSLSKETTKHNNIALIISLLKKLRLQ
jgi:hypothetical protein